MIGAVTTTARITAAALLGLLLLTVGVDAVGTSRVDDHRAQARHSLLHPTQTSLGDVGQTVGVGTAGAVVGGP